jgi:hypothetical protein
VQAAVLLQIVNCELGQCQYSINGCSRDKLVNLLVTRCNEIEPCEKCSAAKLAQEPIALGTKHGAVYVQRGGDVPI